MYKRFCRLKKGFFAGLFMIATFASTALAQPKLTNPLTGDMTALSLPQVVGRVVAGILAITALVAVLFIVWGGLKMIFSQGNADNVKEGKIMLFYAVLGLIISYSGYIFINFLLGQIQGFVGS